MDKETLSNYGWIVICVMVLAVMIALATPFGSFISVAIKNTTSGLFDVEQRALTSTGLITIPDQNFDGDEEHFYDKAPNVFAISNYYEVVSTCPCFGEDGLLDIIMNKCEEVGYDIYSEQTWAGGLAFLHEHLNEEFKNHMHGKPFAFEYEFTDGMTWADFINSQANGGDFSIHTDGTIYCSIEGYSYGHLLGVANNTKVYSTDVINKDIMYTIGYWSIS